MIDKEWAHNLLIADLERRGFVFAGTEKTVFGPEFQCYYKGTLVAESKALSVVIDAAFEFLAARKKVKQA